MKQLNLSKLQSGIGMVEIMLAMAIGVFLMGGLIQMFITTQRTNRLQDAISRVQENGRFAMEFITQDIRMADYFMECGTAARDANAVEGTNNDSGSNIIADTDTITVRQTAGSCDNRQTTTTRYYIGTGVNGQPSLCKIQVTNAALPALPATCGNYELIEGIENMQILYGVDTDPHVVTDAAEEVAGTPNYYVPATNVVTATTDWEDVVSIKVSLLARTLDDNVTTQPVPYTYNGASTTPTDHRIRRIYNSTITLRNRLH